MPDAKQPAAEDSAAQSGGKLSLFLWRRWVTKKSIAALVIVSIAIQGGGFLFFTLRRAGTEDEMLGEVSLGKFQFLAAATDRGGVEKATFQLHLSLLGDMQEVGRDRLEERKFKVQQGVEELLRQAGAGDFEDPTLAELKRQLQEKINDMLGKRVIAEVILTDLAVDRVARPASATPGSSTAAAATPAAPAEPNATPAVGWQEKNPG